MSGGEPLRRLFRDSDDLCEYIREKFGDTVVVHFSMGKDSLCTWLQCRRYFKTIIPVYFYFFPKLGFVEKQLAYYEDFFQTKIWRYPRETFWWHLDDYQYQPPWRVIPLGETMLPRAFTSYDIDADVRVKTGAVNAWSAVGLRAYDSLTRRTAFRRAGPLRPQLRFFYPIFDWKFDRMVEALRTAEPAPGASERTISLSKGGIRLPIDYRLFNRSFDSPRSRFLVAIREKFPEDYARIQFWLPLIEAEMKRHEWGKKARASADDREAEEVMDLETAAPEDIIGGGP